MGAMELNIGRDDIPVAVTLLCRRIGDAGGRGWLVGGCVRDLLLGIAPKDFDVEVFGLPEAALLALLGELGRVESVGKQFGVHKLWLEGLEIDVALPRTERKSGTGHCGFTIHSDPGLDPERATLRRDFTMNAMMFDPLAGELLDLHDGAADLRLGRLRHVGPAFIEDPLRPLRAMQFAARFSLRLDEQTAALCREMLPEAASLPLARIWEEWRKWALSPAPGHGLQLLADSGWLSLYPELARLVDCPQDPRWHPEGDVWGHTLQSCDRAAEVAEARGLGIEMRLPLLFGVLAHDLGKPATTGIDVAGRITSRGHCDAGLPLAESLFERIGVPGRIRQQVAPLIREHMTHMHGEPTERAVRRLADRLVPAHIELWEMLVEADASGRAPAPPSRPALGWLEVARELSHQHGRPRPLLTGAMLIERGMAPGPEMGVLLDLAYQAQLDGEITDRASAIAWLERQ